MGRFLNRDRWMGAPNRPMSYNRWNYVEGNPITRTDPSGLCWYPNPQTGGVLIDSLTPNPNLCPWFIEAMKQQGWNVPPDARPENWDNNIPESERTLLIVSNPNLNFVGSTNNANMPLWQIVYYGKSPSINSYTETPNLVPLHQDIDRMVPFYGLPIVIGGGGGTAMRCEPGKGCYAVTQAYTHTGLGFDIINGILQLHLGLQIGDDTGLYFEGELFGQNCGIKFSYPDMGFYSAWGDVGLTVNTYDPHWFLTTENYIYEAGGYSAFGVRNIEEGFSSYYVYDEDYNRDDLLLRWNLNMSRSYALELRP